MKIIELNCESPTINSVEIKNNKLHLSLNDDYTDYNVIVSKTKDNKYIWNDEDIFIRTFDSVEFLMWEFELPNELKEIIQSLPNVSDKEVSFIDQSVFDYKPHLELLDELINL